MKIYILYRYKPNPGQERGCVADAAVYPDGTAILKWRTDPGGIEIYPSEADMRNIRERSGRSQFLAGS